MSDPPVTPLAVDAMSVALYSRRQLRYQREHITAPLCATTPGGGAAHPRVLVLAPRQTGKTTAIWLTALARTYLWRHHHAVYAAQQGTVSTRRFALTGAWLDQVKASPLAPRLARIRSQGREAVTRPDRGSYFMALNPRPGAARSDALDLVVLDECQEHTFTRAEQLLSDIGPTFATRPRRQMILAGTATDGPTWWRSQVTAARRHADGAGHLIEIGTWPDDADPTDPATWWAHHPGLQAGLTTEAFLTEQLHTLGPDAFAREYGNRFGDAAPDSPIPMTAWDAATAAPGGTPHTLALDVTPDRSSASLVGVSSTGHARLVATCALDQVPAVVHRLASDTGRHLAVHVLPGQTGTAAQLRAAGHAVTILTGGDYTTACQQLHDDVAAGLVHHDHQTELRDAWTIAARRWHGDTWVLSARSSGGDVTAAVALVVAWWAHRAGAPTLV